jgi:hypothetical protein
VHSYLQRKFFTRAGNITVRTKVHELDTVTSTSDWKNCWSPYIQDILVTQRVEHNSLYDRILQHVSKL